MALFSVVVSFNDKTTCIRRNLLPLSLLETKTKEKFGDLLGDLDRLVHVCFEGDQIREIRSNPSSSGLAEFTRQTTY